MRQFTGHVASGIGYGVEATQLPWFREAIADQFGFDPVPGTLNLNHVSAMPGLRELLLTSSTVLVPPNPTFCCALLLPVRILRTGQNDLPAVVVRPLVKTYPSTQVELVAPHHFRTLLQIGDGDPVTFAVWPSDQHIPWVQPQALSPIPVERSERDAGNPGSPAR